MKYIVIALLILWLVLSLAAPETIIWVTNLLGSVARHAVTDRWS